MAKMPNIKGLDRSKPLCYDPGRDMLITIDNLIQGEAKIVPLDSLTDGQQKLLVVERLRRGPDFTEQAISGPPRTRDEVVEEIEANTEYGRLRVQVEIGYLQELLQQVQEAL